MIKTIILLYSLWSSSFCQDRPQACLALTEFWQEQSLEIRAAAKLAGEQPEFFVSIAGPEIANFSRLKNMIEYRTMEVFYVNWGEDYANFSIGPMQMKPIFAKQIELDLERFSSLKDWRSKFAYRSRDPIEMRRERIERLNSAHWQLQYLAAFCKLLPLHHPSLKFDSETERLIFCAAAYNRGYTHSSTEIKEWSLVAWFPDYGRPPAYPYANVALEIWEILKNWVIL